VAVAEVSYAQRFEDLYLLRCFGDQADGFYVDIGAGHPVYDNVSFAFYLKGWRGVTVEPNPWLARLSRAVRPRDIQVEALVGEAPGQATYYRVRDYHGLSTMIADNARAAEAEFGKGADASVVPVTTLRDVCAMHAPAATVDFLKIDVEGAEKDVLLGGDWQQFRPRVVVAEALAPTTLAPAWEVWEPLLLQQNYRFVFFDSLNRYYVAEEAADLARHFTAAPTSFPEARQFNKTRPALTDAAHPDHRLATLMAGAAMTQLPALDRGLLLDLLIADLPPAELGRAANREDVTRALGRIFGPDSPLGTVLDLKLPPGASLRDLYAAILDTDHFRAACGRISASYAW
jgi:FkbM family methyltransferase